MAGDSSINTNRENVPSSQRPETKRKEEVESSEEIKEAGLDQQAYTETIGLDESAETTGRVSEVLTKAKEQKAAGVSGAKPPVTDPAQIRAELLKKIPSEKAMKQQIEQEIKKEIKYLHKKAIKMMRSPNNMSYFEMTNLMKKIRELKGILLTLVKASLAKLKTLWLRFVHGVM